MITYGSRYVLSNILVIISQDGTEKRIVSLDRYPFKVSDLKNGWSYRTITQGKVAHSMDLDDIAYDISGREGMWFLIADVNEILDPFDDISDNQPLVIPSKQSFDKVKAVLDRRG